MKPQLVIGMVVLTYASSFGQWVMVVNNTFLAAPNNSSVTLVNRADGTLVDRNWIVPAAGAGNWNGNCSAQDAVQVGNQVWVGSSNSNCAMPAAIYIYDISFGGAAPVATFNSVRFLTVADVGIASTQPRGLYYNAAAGRVYMTDGNGIHALDTFCNYTGFSLPGNAWGITQLRDGRIAYSVIASGGIRTANETLAVSYGTLVTPTSSGFWPYELDVAHDGRLLASGFASTGYNIRAWSSTGAFLGDPYPGSINLRGMAVLDDGSYLLARNVSPYHLFTWNGATQTVIVADTGPSSPAQNHYGPYMMGYLDVPSAPTLGVSQPLGSGSFLLEIDGLLTGADTFTLVSFEPAPGGPGTGPYLGLYTADLNNLIAQVVVPAGFEPFHFVPSRPHYAFGPVSGLPVGIYVEIAAFQLVSGAFVGLTPVAAINLL